MKVKCNAWFRLWALATGFDTDTVVPIGAMTSRDRGGGGASSRDHNQSTPLADQPA